MTVTFLIGVLDFVSCPEETAKLFIRILALAVQLLWSSMISLLPVEIREKKGFESMFSDV